MQEASRQRPHFSPRRDRLLRVLAVTLMLGGAAMLFTDGSVGIAIPVIAVGIAITAMIDRKRRRQG